MQQVTFLIPHSPDSGCYQVSIVRLTCLDNAKSSPVRRREATGVGRLGIARWQGQVGPDPAHTDRDDADPPRVRDEALDECNVGGNGRIGMIKAPSTFSGRRELLRPFRSDGR